MEKNTLIDSEVLRLWEQQEAYIKAGEAYAALYAQAALGCVPSFEGSGIVEVAVAEAEIYLSRADEFRSGADELFEDIAELMTGRAEVRQAA